MYNTPKPRGVTRIETALDDDLLPFSAYLWSQRIAHRIYEEQGRQVLEVQSGGAEARVLTDYRAWRDGELVLKAVARRPGTLDQDLEPFAVDVGQGLLDLEGLEQLGEAMLVELAADGLGRGTQELDLVERLHGGEAGGTPLVEHRAALAHARHQAAPSRRRRQASSVSAATTAPPPLSW